MNDSYLYILYELNDSLRFENHFEMSNQWDIFIFCFVLYKKQNVHFVIDFL